MTEQSIKEITEQFSHIQLMNYVISGLLVLTSAMFGAIIWYFKKDAEETKSSITITENLSNQNSRDILMALSEIKHNREETDKVLRILAKHTGANIGL